MGYVYECLSPPAEYLDVSPPDVFCKKRVLLEISQNSKETAATLVQVFSCEFCEISKSNFSTEHLRTTASVHMEHRITLITFDYGTLCHCLMSIF